MKAHLNVIISNQKHMQRDILEQKHKIFIKHRTFLHLNIFINKSNKVYITDVIIIHLPNQAMSPTMYLKLYF
jgi:hypothetical protein